MKKIITALVIIVLVSCGKTPILEHTSDLAGTWKHNFSEGNSHTLIINEDGSGRIEWEENGEKSKATKLRDWYIKDEVLYFGKGAFNGEQYAIDQYPKVAWEELIHYYDTIPETKKYIILDNFYYVEQ